MHQYSFEDLKRETIATDVSSFDVSINAKTLIYRSGYDLRVLKAGDKPNNAGRSGRSSGWLDLYRINILVEPEQEWKQMYREVWRLQRDHFWVEDMAGVDWLSIYNRYLPLIKRLTTRAEFSDLMWEMQGELGTSHAYESGGDYRPEPDYAQGFLGADFEYDDHTQAYKITHIVLGDVWDEKNTSPLSGLGLNINPGDYLLAINGQRLSQNLPPEKLLVNLAGQYVRLSILRQGEEKPTDISIKTLYSEFQARYREWVESNRQWVHTATQGQVGYVHIPDMGASGFAEFHRSYLAEVAKTGLIVDVRYNRGGHVSSLILEKLARRPIGYDVSRWGQPEAYPREAVVGPIVALCNQFSASDGDMFSHAFKLMGLGPLIGTRTWGGVIGISPQGALVDGGYTTQPEYSFWFSDVGWQVENYGTDPDIIVNLSPNDYVTKQDPQLKRAIQEAMEHLQSKPVKLPEFGVPPSRVLPKLPPR